jgi:transglutaminase-like putative cysteine protease
MLLHITHTTTYRYAPQVNSAQHMAHVLPRDTPAQQVVNSALAIAPEPATRSDAMDVYGNHRTFFSLPAAHDTLHIAATSTVRTQALAFQPEALPGHLGWEKVRAHFSYHAGAAWDAATEFTFASDHVQPHADFAQYARASFTPQRPVLEAAVDLMQRIHRDFEYASQSTDVHTPALQALAQRRGVCQDFAHILLSCLRTQGLAARYVSGYLLTEPPEGQPRLIGSDASHAWVSMYVPSTEGIEGTEKPNGWWFDLDPTNNRWGLHSPGEDYVCLAWGRDFSDVSPVRGVIHGGASHTLEVGVTVLPMDAPSDEPVKSACPQA